MKTKILVLGAALIVASATAFAGTTIRFQPGADGQTKISTPWGEYAAYRQGSTIWIGTAEEFESNRVKGIMSDKGLKEFNVAGNQKSYIERDLPATAIGSTDIASISPFILFDVAPDKKLKRPVKPAGYEYVSVMWLQNSKQNITAAIYDESDKTAYQPFTCRVSADWHTCETLIPKAALNHPVYIAFTAAKQKPALVPFESLALGQYSNYLVQRRGMGKTPPTSEDLADQKNMHLVDARIPSP